MYLDTLDPLHAQVGFGALGRRGDLGYEGKRVIVGRKVYEHASARTLRRAASRALRRHPAVGVLARNRRLAGRSRHSRPPTRCQRRFLMVRPAIGAHDEELRGPA
jgi:hypothetical protein